MSMPILVAAPLSLFVFICTITDLRSRRIPNSLSGPALLTGVSVNWLLSGPAGLVHSLAGMLLLILLLIAPFALGGIGGGDVKMMAAVGAWLGPRLGAASVTAGVVIGGAIMVAHLARTRQLTATLQRIRNMLLSACVARSLAPLRVSASAPQAIALPYSIPLALGTLIVLFISCLW